MTEILNLKYSGREITLSGGMDVSEVADTLDGFSDFIQSVTSELQDEEVRSSLVVQGFRRGSFDIQLALEFAAAAQTAISTIGTGNLLDTLKQAFNLLKHLKGEPPKTIRQADHGSVFVENNAGQIIIINQPVVHAVLNTNASQAAEKFIKQPLRAAAEKLEVRVNNKVAAKIDRSSSENFTTIGAGDPLGEFKSKQYLTIQTVVLEGDGLAGLGLRGSDG